MRIALAGNPNSGKTTIYNALTGRNEKVGNWAGVTVDRRESAVKKSYNQNNDQLILVDLPGAYSMSPFTSEESITSSYVKNEKPEAIINIVDATNLSRSLFFTTQLLELGIPMVIALNKNDINEKKETVIDEKQLSELIGCPVVKTTATSEAGLKQVIEVVQSLKGKAQKINYHQGEINLHDKQEVEQADRKRYEYVNSIVSKVETRKVLTKEYNSDDKLDAILTHPVKGLIIFAIVMFMVFHISQSEGPLGLGKYLEGLFTGWLDIVIEWVAGFMEDSSPFLQALVVDGILGGVSAVLGFLPLVMVMYFLIALLEDCGYMARATVVLDPIFKKVGLSGKSVIPFVVGTGCAIPGIMACRTIKNERERRATAMLCTFMPCGAKLPVIALFAGAFFPESTWVGPVMYFVGIGLILLGALLIKAINGAKFRKNFFIIELPEYKAPSFKFACKSMLERGKAYIVKAGTIILVCNTIVQIMATFTPAFQVAAEDGADSILALIASPFAVLLVPVVGVACWQLAAAAITGFIAKENVVGTLATVFAITNFIDTEELEMMEGAGSEVAMIMGITKIAALAYLMFNLYTPPCFAALGAMRSEMKSKKWFWGGVGFMLSTGYTIGFLVYQFGNLFVNGSFGPGFTGGLIFTIVIAALYVYLILRAKVNLKKEYQK